MIVSWNWLKQYVRLDMSAEELQERLTMAGLNHEGTEQLGDDLAIDLEVTSNRPDCLGHIGVAREVAVLFGHELKVPATRPPEVKTLAEDLVRVSIECPDLCPRYTARVIRGVKVGPSPKWMLRRLATLGISAINNVVDITNYVLMECGQPLHTFDYARLKGPEIVVRRPRGGEQIEAIDHNTYDLPPDACVIADARDPVAIGGVMGGAQTEISGATTDILVAGVTVRDMTIAYYGWLQTWGVCNVLYDGSAGTMAAGTVAVLSDGVAGAVTVLGQGTAIASEALITSDFDFGQVTTEPIVGYMMEATTNAEYGPVYLQLCW